MSNPSERGISPVVSATLVIAIVAIGMGVYLEQVVPSYQRKNEIDHMNAARAAFLNLQAMILNRDSGNLAVPMSTEPTPIFTLPPPTNRIDVTPAKWVKRFQPKYDAYVDSEYPDTKCGTDNPNILSVRSYKPAVGSAQNRRVFLDFDVASDTTSPLWGISSSRISEAWLALYCENISKFMGNPWGIESDYDLKNSGSWDQCDWAGGSGQLNWSNPAKFYSSENIDWENFHGQLRLAFQEPAEYFQRGELVSSIYNSGSTLTAWGLNDGLYERPSGTNIYVQVRFSNDGIFDDSETMEDWRYTYKGSRFDFGTVHAEYAQYKIILTSNQDNLDTLIFKDHWLLNVDNFFLPDVPVKVEAREVTGAWTEGDLTWNNQPAYGDTITAMNWPWEDNHTIKDNEAWFTWDVTSLVRRRIDSEEDVGILLKAVYEGASQERYANFSSKERVVNGGMKVINENEGTSSDSVAGHPCYPTPYLAVFYENGDLPGPPLFDNWGALIECGNVTFNTDYYNFPSISFTFESGALFQQVYGQMYTLLISDPGAVVGTRLDPDTYHDNIAIYVNRYRIINREQYSSSVNANLKVTVKENFDSSIYPEDVWTITPDGPMRHLENVMITFRTDFEWAWKYYLRDLTLKWNTSSTKGGLEDWANYYGHNIWSNNVVEFEAKLYVDHNIRLYTWGRVEDPAVQDIFYYDRTYDVEVKVVV